MRFVREWEITPGRYVVLVPAVAEVLLSYQQSAPRLPEAGGILLGYRRGPHIEVRTATTPMANDVRRRTYFGRLDAAHNTIAVSQWKEDPYIHYVGEWHTHPEIYPSPSRLDANEWRIIGRANHPDPMLMLVIGLERCWVGLQTGNSVTALRPCS